METKMNVDRKVEAAPLLTAREVAKRLHVGIATVWRLRASGAIPQPVKFGGCVRWRTSDIDTWLSASCPEVDKVKVTR